MYLWPLSFWLASLSSLFGCCADRGSTTMTDQRTVTEKIALSVLSKLRRVRAHARAGEPGYMSNLSASVKY